MALVLVLGGTEVEGVGEADEEEEDMVWFGFGGKEGGRAGGRKGKREGKVYLLGRVKVVGGEGREERNERSRFVPAD